MTPDEIAQRLQQFEALCRERGSPLTVQRRDILKAILERDDHPSADQIYESVKDRIPGLSRTTVYRVLDTLVELGAFGDCTIPEAGPGSTASCTGTTIWFAGNAAVSSTSRAPALDSLKVPAGGRQGFEIEDYSVHFIGLCQACLRQGSK